MILQALYEYYQRKPDLPREGFENVKLKFIIVIKKDGTFVDLVDKREGKQGKEYLLPKAKGRAGSKSWQTTFLLWDHYGYVLGHPKGEDKAAIDMAGKQHKVFVDSVKDLPEELKEDKGVKAVLGFYESHQEREVKKHANWAECSKIAGCNLTFQLDGDLELIPQRQAVEKYQSSVWDKIDEDDGQPYEAPCLIRGERSRVVRVHTATPIFESKSKSTARIVGIQKHSGYDSYKKEQGYNAPISLRAEYGYTTALKYLVRSRNNHTLVNDTTILFWAQQRSKGFDLEIQLPWFISTEDNPDRGVQAVKALYEAVESGQLPLEEHNRFYILGLAAPTPARISIRFWKVGTVREFSESIYSHFKDLEIDKLKYERDHCTLNELLAGISIETKDMKKPNVIFYKHKRYEVIPHLAESIVHSVLDGAPYPETLLHQCIRRIRAEVSRKDKKGKLVPNVTRPRAAILKAYFNRINRTNKLNKKEVSMALDPEYDDVGYVLGRLFALLEEVQEQSAKPSRLNSTIRERYYASFSTSPPVVMQSLMNLKNHHLKKLGGGLRNWYEREIAEVTNLLDAKTIPAHLALEQQAKFAIGYYHQRVHKDKKES